MCIRDRGKTLGTSNVGGDLVVETRADGGSLDERLRITGSGDLCVGKTSAIGKAEIATSASEIGLTVSNSVHDSQLQILASASNKNSSIFFGDGGDGNIGWIDYDHNDNSLSFRVNGSTRAWFDNSNTLYLQGTSHTNLEVRSNSTSTKAVIQTVQDSDVRMGATTNHPLALYAGTVERVRISSDGQLGINKSSPKAWHTDYRSLQIHDAGYIAGSTDDSFVAIGANNYLDTGGSYDYTNSDFASQLYQVDGTLVLSLIHI